MQGDTMIQEAVDRVKQMELYFDMLQDVANNNPNAILTDDSIKAKLQILMEYYKNGQWLQDYELDEKRCFPQTLKRGILTQDAFFDFLDGIQKMTERE